MKYATKTNNKTVLLAILAVFAMIAAGAAMVATGSAVNADGAPPVETTTDTTGPYEALPAIVGDTYTVPTTGKVYQLDMSAAATDIIVKSTNLTYTLYVIPSATKTLTVKDINDGAGGTVTIKVAQTFASATSSTVYTDLVMRLTGSASPEDAATLKLSAGTATTGPSAEVTEVTGFTVDATTYGIQFHETDKDTFYAKGATITDVLAMDAAGENVKILNGTATIEQKASTTEGKKALAGKIAIGDAEDTENITIAYAEGANAVPMTVLASDDYAPIIAMVSGTAKIITNDITLTHFTGLASGEGTADTVLYGPGIYAEAQTPAIAFAQGDLGEGTISIYQAEAAAIDFTTVTASDFKVKVGATTYATKLTGATFALTGSEITTAVTAGTVELVSGEFATGNLAHTATVQIDTAATLKIKADIANWQGEIDCYGTIASNDNNAKTITTTGDLTVTFYPDAKVNNVTFTGATVQDDTPGTQIIGGTLEENMTVGNAKLGSALTVPEGVTLTINGALGLETFNLIVAGNLVIGTSGVIVTKTGQVVLEETADITNNGKIGNMNGVQFNNGVEGSIIVQGVMGAQIDQVSIKTGESTYTRFLTLTGILIDADPSSSNPAIVTVNKVYADDDLTVSTGVTLKATTNPLTVMSGCTLTVMSGAALGNNEDDIVALENGAALIMNGSFMGYIDAKVMNGINADLSNYVPANIKDVKIQSTTANSVSGFTVYTDRISYTVGTAVKYDQRAYIEGALVAAPNADTLSTAAITVSDGYYLFVDKEDILTMASKAYLTGNFIVALGTVSIPTSVAAEASVPFGVKFTIAPQGGTSMDYYTDFDSALENIESAVGKTISINGLAALSDKANVYTMPTLLEIENGWVVNSTGAATIMIPATSTVYVESGATFKATAIADIAGMLVVESGASCAPSASQYAVVSTDAEGTKTYAGIAVILAEAEAGDKITLSGNATSASVLTVPAGVEFTIAATLATKGLVIEEGAIVKVTGVGTLQLNGTATSPYTLTVNGVLDASAGSVTVGAKGTITSNCEFKTTTAKYNAIKDAEGVTIVGATFVSEDCTILTTASLAMLSGANVTISSKYTSAEDIVLAEGTTLTIDGAEVTLGSISIADGTIVTANDGTISATISGVTGVDGAKDVEIQVSGFKGQLSDKMTVNAKAEEVWTFQTDAAMTAGSVLVSEGTLTVKHALAGAETDYFVVASGATLSLSADPNFTGFALVTITGDVTTGAGIGMTTNVETIIAGDVTTKGAFVANADLMVAGSLTVAGASTIGDAAADSFVLTGSLTIPETATLTVTAYMYIDTGSVGAGATISGIVALGNTACVISDDDISDNFGAAVNELVLAINAVPYEYVYANKNNGPTFEAFLGNKDVVFSVPGLNLTGIKSVVGGSTLWVDMYGDSIAAATKVGAVSYAVFLAEVSTVDVIASWDTGMSLYIDNVRVTLPEVELEVGTHTVMVKVNPGYKFADGTTPSITFAGKAVTGLLVIEVTSDMVGTNPILSATADIVIDEQPIPEQKEKDDTMMIILLAILVIMIAILVVVVILRMMRS